MESIKIIEGLLTAAIKALPVEDFYKIRGEEPPKAETDLTKATSGDLLHQLVVLGDVPLALGELSSAHLVSELLGREEGVKALPSHELAQALIDREDEAVLLDQVDITEHLDFDSVAEAYGSDKVLDYVECNFCIDDILHRLDEDEVAAWVAATGRTVLDISVERLSVEITHVLHTHSAD